MNKLKKVTLLVILVLCITEFVVVPMGSAAYKSGKVYKAKISFLGSTPVSDGIKFKYIVKSGKGYYRIKRWQLKSTAFKKYDVIDASEHYLEHKNSKYLTFNKGYRDCEKRYVWFVIEGDYTTIKTGSVKASIRIRNRWMTTWTKGPKLV